MEEEQSTELKPGYFEKTNLLLSFWPTTDHCVVFYLFIYVPESPKIEKADG